MNCQCGCNKPKKYKVKYHFLDIISSETLGSLLDDFRAYAWGKFGTEFFRRPGQRLPPKWFLWTVKRLYSTVRKIYFQRWETIRHRIWRCPVCGAVACGTRLRFTEDFPDASMCPNFHMWNNKTGKVYEQPFASVASAIKDASEQFGSDTYEILRGIKKFESEMSTVDK